MMLTVINHQGAGFGIGAALGLTEDQLDRRAASVTVLDGPNVPSATEDRIACRVDVPVMFKIGEDVELLSDTGFNTALFLVAAESNSAAAKKAKATRRSKRARGAKINRERSAARAEEEANRKAVRRSAKKKPPTKSRRTKKPAGLAKDETAADNAAGRTETRSVDS